MAKLINLIPANQKPKQNEALQDMDVALPSKVERFLERLVQTIKSYNLPKKKEQAVIARVMDSMGITTSELNQAVQKLKKYDVVKRQRTGNDDHDFMGERLNEAKELRVYTGTYKLEETKPGSESFDITFGNVETGVYMIMNPEDAKVYGMSGVDVKDLFQKMVDDQKKRRKI
jgi:hypothetical protein